MIDARRFLALRTVRIGHWCTRASATVTSLSQNAGSREWTSPRAAALPPPNAGSAAGHRSVRLMQVAFRKLSDTRHKVTVTRLDGSRDVVAFDSKDFLRHDLAHFAFEVEAGLKHGVPCLSG